MSVLLRRLLWAVVCLAAVTTPCRAGSHKLTKLAVVDVGSGERVPANFMDFIVLSMSREPQIALLEREQVERVLREQSLGMMLAGTNAVRIGKLVATDAFLMLELQTNQAIRVRLVDAHYGLKLWDAMFMAGTNTKDLEQDARALAKGTVFRLANLLCGTDTPRTVSISAFRSEEISKRWDWLGETLGTGIEQQLALQPGIVVMERARTRPLTERHPQAQSDEARQQLFSPQALAEMQSDDLNAAVAFLRKGPQHDIVSYISPQVGMRTAADGLQALLQLIQLDLQRLPEERQTNLTHEEQIVPAVANASTKEAVLRRFLNELSLCATTRKSQRRSRMDC